MPKKKPPRSIEEAVQQSKDAFAEARRIKTARELAEIEERTRWAKAPVCVIENTSNRPIIWDIKGRGTGSLRIESGRKVRASAMQMESMTNPPPGLVVRRYNPDNPEHIRLKGIG